MSSLASVASPSAEKRVYSFGGGVADGRGDQRELLGGKGAGLAEMSRLGLRVPPGFTIGTPVCAEYFAAGNRLPGGLEDEIRSAIARVEKAAGARFGDPERPLLVSVRSGARASMPGMMDTVLDVGLGPAQMAGLARWRGRRFALDCRRRFITMYSDVVLGMSRKPFEEALARAGSPPPEDALARAVDEMAAIPGGRLPEEPMDQLLGAVRAVFSSWNNARAIAYRKLNGIPESWGTAVNVQAMVFGNTGERSGTGVAFTRDPATGEPRLYGEFLVDAQGEDVVAGIRSPQAIEEMAKRFPEAYSDLLAARERLELHYRDMQDVEFTVQDGVLWMLQCRSGKRSGFAAVRIAVDLAQEGVIDEREAISRVEPAALEQVLRPTFETGALRAAEKAGRVLGGGLPAGPGAASGVAVFTPAEAEARAARGESVILVRAETSPEDVRGMHASAGILTAVGGMTSHAALVARQMGKVAVVGCSSARVDEHARRVAFGGRAIGEGEWLSLDGFTGRVYSGKLATTPPEVVRALVEKSLPLEEAPTARRLLTLLSWADRVRRLRVRANADLPDQAAVALAFGAEGIGLCRTEHMFFGADRIGPMRRMILAETVEERRAALAVLLPLQRGDFAGLFRAMDGRPVNIRLLDPPLHEFLPADDAGVEALARELSLPPARVHARIAALREKNPMLGLRGCRLGISHPEISGMQARAMGEAACDVAAEGIAVRLEIMIPLVGERRELDAQAAVVREALRQVFAERGSTVPFEVGTMIEVPRAALVAGDLARSAEFFSFGTNDLTQTTLGLSRDDVGPVLASYLERGIYDADPFATLDREGVGRLVKLAVEEGRAARPGLHLGICGEHGGDPASIAFCHEVGLDYVSCSPMRIAVARLAAARAALG